MKSRRRINKVISRYADELNDNGHYESSKSMGKCQKLICSFIVANQEELLKALRKNARERKANTLRVQKELQDMAEIRQFTLDNLDLSQDAIEQALDSLGYHPAAVQRIIQETIQNVLEADAANEATARNKEAVSLIAKIVENNQ